MSKVPPVEDRPVEPRDARQWGRWAESCVIVVTTWLFLSTWANGDAFSKAPGTCFYKSRVFHQVVLARLQLVSIHARAELAGHMV